MAAFELHPETPRGGALLPGRPGDEQRARAWADNILVLARESGLAMRMPRLVANSQLALEAAESTRVHPRPRGLLSALLSVEVTIE